MTTPVAIRKHLGIRTPDKIAFVLKEDGQVALRPAKLTLAALRGIVPAIPVRVTSDFEDQIEEAMEEEAARIVSGMQGW